MIECRTMASAERYDAFALMKRFRADTAALGEALSLFVDGPITGLFGWPTSTIILPRGVSASLGIDTETGGLVATLRDLFVLPERRRGGIGSALLLTVQGRLEQLGVTRIEAACGADATLRPFFEARSYRANGLTFSWRR